MIEEIQWPALKSLLNLLSQNSGEIFILFIYILTIKKTYAYCMGFLLCSLAAYNNYFGVVDLLVKGFNPLDKDVYYGIIWWCANILTWISCVVVHLIHTRNKSLLFWCATMLVLQLLMAFDWYANTYDNQSILFESYSTIVVCIHVGICLSFYKPDGFINATTHYVYNILRMPRCFRFVPYIWYTTRHRKSNQRLQCRTNK